MLKLIIEIIDGISDIPGKRAAALPEAHRVVPQYLHEENAFSK
jgi:hypothetical protein